MNDTTDQTIPKIASVTVKKAVDGTARRKRRGKGKARVLSTETHSITVDPRVMAAAKQARLPGQRLVIVDAETVMLVNQ